MLRKYDRFIPISYCIYGALFRPVGMCWDCMFIIEKPIQYSDGICAWLSFPSFGNKFSYAEKKRFRGCIKLKSHRDFVKPRCDFMKSRRDFIKPRCDFIFFLVANWFLCGSLTFYLWRLKGNLLANSKENGLLFC